VPAELAVPPRRLSVPLVAAARTLEKAVAATTKEVKETMMAGLSAEGRSEESELRWACLGTMGSRTRDSYTCGRGIQVEVADTELVPD
jgi:hypothetical protein